MNRQSKILSTVLFVGVALALLVALAVITQSADVVPTDVQMPGTQPKEVGNLESPDKCDNCHGGYDKTVEPAFNWRGSMMANAGRDPIFWATLAIAEQDFDGSGDLCIRCHSPDGWINGRSVPTDGSALQAGDGDGVACDLCHKLTNPDNSEHNGVQNSPFIANDGGSPATGYYGSGMYVLWGGSDKLGPYSDAQARHQWKESTFHRSSDLCGTCHDVSNAVVGDLAHNNGAQVPLWPGNYSGILGDSVENKAAFNNFPYQYGIVERTFSEHMASALWSLEVSEYPNLPADLQDGAFKAVYESALIAQKGGDYEDGTTRYFTCQSCHVRPVNGQGCNKKGAPVRKDLPLHDMTGGNYWIPDAIVYLDNQNKLLLGGGLDQIQKDALAAGKIRALKQLNEAAGLSVDGNTLKVTNLAGHKLITGYPEGRRMWLNIQWYDADGNLLREDGEYGDLTVKINGQDVTVKTLLDLDGMNTEIYEAHYAITQEWAYELINTYGFPSNLPISYDRVTGDVDYTLGELAAQSPGTYHESFHFVLNNYVAKDNRIPPYGFAYNAAEIRNALPVPADQFGNPGPGGVYNYWDNFTLSPPSGAIYANIDLVYQPTSWEYIQFLYLANTGGNDFLKDEGINLLDAWLNTGMAEPYVMTSTTWGDAPAPPVKELRIDSLTTWYFSKRGVLVGQTDTFKQGTTVGIMAHAVDVDGNPLSGAQVFLDIKDSNGNVVKSLQGFTDENGNALVTWKTSRKQAVGTYTANITDVLKNGYEYNPSESATSATFYIVA